MARSKHTPAARHGVKWIRPSTRFAIYHRDSFECVYCGPRRGVKLTIDHHVSVHSGGTNHHTNLLTACHDCNSRKRNLSSRAWLAQLRTEGVNVEALRKRITRRLKKPLDRERGRLYAKAVTSIVKSGGAGVELGPSAARPSCAGSRQP